MLRLVCVQVKAAYEVYVGLPWITAKKVYASANFRKKLNLSCLQNYQSKCGNVTDSQRGCPGQLARGEKMQRFSIEVCGFSD